MSMFRIVSRITANASGQLFLRDQIVRPDKVARIDAALRHELVDVDRAGRFKCDVFQLILRHFDGGVGIDLISLDNVFVRNCLAGVGIYLHVFDAMASVLVNLIEADFFGIGGGPDTKRPDR
jgi:hypothetical protein